MHASCNLTKHIQKPVLAYRAVTETLLVTEALSEEGPCLSWIWAEKRGKGLLPEVRPTKRKGIRGLSPIDLLKKKNKKEGTFHHHYHCDHCSLLFQVCVLI